MVWSVYTLPIPGSNLTLCPPEIISVSLILPTSAQNTFLRRKQIKELGFDFFTKSDEHYNWNSKQLQIKILKLRLVEMGWHERERERERKPLLLVVVVMRTQRRQINEALAMVHWMRLKSEKDGFKLRSAVDRPFAWVVARRLTPPPSQNLGSPSLCVLLLWCVFVSVGFWILKCSYVGFLWISESWNDFCEIRLEHFQRCQI